MSTASLTNHELGKLVGLTHSSISRIRSGHRLPSPDAMVRIEKVLGWPVAEQIGARSGEGKYAKAFERRIRAYAKQRTTPA